MLGVMRQRQSNHDELVESHLGFARALCRRLAYTLPPHVDPEAMESDALFGLLLAARAFDPTRGVAFTTYAARRICGAMLDGLRDRQGGTRGRKPPVVRSLSAPMRDADGREVTLSDLLANGEEEVGAALEQRDEIDHLLNHVRSPERRMVREYYFDDLSQDQIAARHGISASRVSQRIKAARQRMAEVACAN
jgi:RNA polymerase sigma factor (sigma-70 family)